MISIIASKIFEFANESQSNNGPRYILTLMSHNQSMGLGIY